LPIFIKKIRRNLHKKNSAFSENFHSKGQECWFQVQRHAIAFEVCM